MFYFINVLDGIFIAMIIVVFIFIFFKIKSEKKVENKNITLLKECNKCQLILNNGETYIFDKSVNKISFKTKLIHIDKNIIMFDMIDKINLL